MTEGKRLKPELAATIGQWLYLDCHCIVDMGGRAGNQFIYECDACGNKNLRFIHALENCENHLRIDVGIECARVLLDPDEWGASSLHARNAETRYKGKPFRSQI